MKRASLIAVVVGAAAIGWWTSRIPKPAAAVGLWPEGTVWRYQLDHQSDQAVTLVGGDATIAVDTELVGVLRVRGLAGQPRRLGVRLESLATARVKSGEQVIEPATDWTAPEVIATLGEFGQLTTVAFPTETDPVYRNLVQLLLTELQFECRPQMAWETTEQTTRGTARVTYRRTGDAVEKTRTGYSALVLAAVAPDARAEVESTGHATRRPGCVWETAEVSENIRVTADTKTIFRGHTRTQVRLLDAQKDAGEPPPAARLVAQAPAQASGADDGDLTQRIDGLTAAEVLATVTQFRGGKVPQHARFLWRATALIRSDPALAEALLQAFKDAGDEPGTRRFILDLLAGAGSPAAQAALRAALEHEALNPTASHPLYYQRVAMVAAPDAETFDFLQAHYDAPGPEGFDGAALALGRAAGAVRERDPEQAEAIERRLLDDLEASDDPARSAALIDAWGNAGAPPADIVAHASDEDPRVRRAVASAARVGGEDARETLHALAQDAHPVVQNQALDSLATLPLSDADFDQLRSAVLAGAFAESSLDTLRQLAVPYVHQSAAAQAMLRAILDLPLQDRTIKSRVRAMLGG